MDTEIADVVISLNGRDKGKYFIVVGKEDMYSLLADGKGRKIGKPKKKKNKHINRDGVISDLLAVKLNRNDKITNKEIRKALAQYEAEHERGDV